MLPPVAITTSESNDDATRACVGDATLRCKCAANCSGIVLGSATKSSGRHSCAPAFKLTANLIPCTPTRLLNIPGITGKAFLVSAVWSGLITLGSRLRFVPPVNIILCGVSFTGYHVNLEEGLALPSVGNTASSNCITSPNEGPPP